MALSGKLGSLPIGGTGASGSVEQHPQGNAQLPVAPQFLESWCPCGLWAPGMHEVHMHTHMQALTGTYQSLKLSTAFHYHKALSLIHMHTHLPAKLFVCLCLLWDPNSKAICPAISLPHFQETTTLSKRAHAVLLCPDKNSLTQLCNPKSLPFQISSYSLVCAILDHQPNYYACGLCQARCWVPDAALSIVLLPRSSLLKQGPTLNRAGEGCNNGLGKTRG